MKPFPKISIIIPTYNCEATLEACLKSVLSQTYQNKEILIIDGNSQDGTVNIIKNYQSVIRWISEPDAGIYDAMNKGISLATGDWIYFLGSDDVFYNENVLNSVFVNTKNHFYEVLYGDAKFKHSRIRYDGKFSRYKLLHKNICHQAIFVKKAVFVELGYFEAKYKLLADWHFNMKWFNQNTIRHQYVSQIIAIYNENGLSFNVPDSPFIKDRSYIEDLHFPWATRWLFRNRERRFIRQLLPLLYRV